ncbi:MutS-related protein [Pedobacter sp. MW01-1-1]|uniref:MutS-related protein n=1 Tax=Pedobacter sp. MW01-1-1 TaxID=3383027 RepID=UPI003FEF773C
MLKTQEELHTTYQNTTKQAQKNLGIAKKQIDRYSLLRMALFALEIFFIVLFAKAETGEEIAFRFFLLFVPVIAFAWVVKKQSVLDRNVSYLNRLIWVYQNELNMLGNKANGYADGSLFEDDNHPYLSDLDILGKSSLYALINRCSTVFGEKILANHLSFLSSKMDILSRQEAVQEIHLDIERTFDFRAILREHESTQIDRIKQKLNTNLKHDLVFTHKSFLRFYVKIVPFIMIGLALGATLLNPVLWRFFVLMGIFNGALTFYFSKQINKLYHGFTGGANALKSYGEAITWTENKEWKSRYIQSLFGNGEKVSAQINQLSAIIAAFDARLNIVVSSILNLFLLWDVRCCIQLDEWHKKSSANVENGLDRIGYFEELISLATLSYNHPNWVFPTIKDDFCLQATTLGHPLIATEKRISNNFCLTEQPTVDIVTGSNMAGKSTFLRTVGINLVLAYLGAPVCADEMTASLFSLNTYMRIRDSLNESTSTFKAELNRLKMILNNVAQQPDAFVLIDEMLRGTNSKDKYLGSKVFIEKLILEKTPALFATHDLQLADLSEDYPHAVRNYHFDIQIEAGEMAFDYKLKHGPCSTFNASILLKEIGLSLD